MKQCLNEENCCESKLEVRFSSKILKNINTIESINQGNRKGLSEWYKYIQWLTEYLSKFSVVLDYGNNHIKLPNNARFIRDINAYYIIQNNSYKTWVYVFKIDLKPQDYGLKVPQSLGEFKCLPKTIRLTESQFKRMLTECITKIINEIA